MPAKRSQQTLGGLVKKISDIKTNQLLYTLLLIAVFFLGYLLAKTQSQNPVAGFGQTAAPTAQQPGAPQPGTKVDVENGHLPVKGDENAQVTVVEFGDFECPFCGSFYTQTLPQLEEEYIDTGKVKFYYRHFPLTAIHPNAVPLALASECANDQGRFWEMHDKIFDNTATISSVTTATIKQWAAEIGLNTASFNSCFDSKKYQSLVDDDMQAGQAAGVTGTPTFFINGQMVVGAQPYDSFKTIIDEELN